MAPETARALTGRVLTTLALILCSPAPAHALRLVDWNVLNYPGTTAAIRNPLYATVLAPIAPDVFATEEITSQAGVDQFLGSVLNTLEPGQWAAAPFVDGNDTDASLFYKPAKVQFLGQWGFYPNPANLLRLVHVYRIKPVGYASDAAEIRLYAVHLKASSGATNVSQRAAEAAGMRDSMNAAPPGTHCIALGDFNLYTGAEPALTRLTESLANDNGRLYDPLNLIGIPWQDNTAIQPYWTQSPCSSGGAACASGASTGGLDDRFDLFLPTYNFRDGTGLELVANSYVAVGNDGQHHNDNITDPPTIPEGAAYASALIRSSDHLPIRIDLSVPAILAGAPSLDLGTVIVGAGATYTLANPAVAPADGLNYSLAASPGFSAPAGAFEVAAGGVSEPHAITTTAGPLGARTGTLTVTSDAPDAPAYIVSLSANVLDHASASLDSAAIIVIDSLAFDHRAGEFTDRDVRVHNFGFDPLHARLDVTSQTITGPDAARFSLLNPGAALLSNLGQTYTVRFDETGATADQSYTADLAIASADEILPGAAEQPDLVVHLRGIVRSTAASVGDALPAFTRLLAPFPNPLTALSTVRFDIAERGHARLEVFDLGGRRVSVLAEGEFAPGHHSARWYGTDDAGFGVGPGVYFVRMTAPNGQTSSARLLVVR